MSLGCGFVPFFKKVTCTAGKEFVGVDTPGLGDPSGNEVDRERATGIVDFLRDKLGNSKINAIVYLHKGTATRNNFEILRMYNYLFGEDLWKHLVIEVTFWENGDEADSKRKIGSPELYTNDLMANKLRSLISDTTNIPKNVTMPVVFINSIFRTTPIDKSLSQAIINLIKSLTDDEIDDISKLQQIISEPKKKLQDDEISKLEQIIFNSNSEGFSCSDKCKRVIPPKAGKPFLVDAPKSAILKRAHGTDLSIKCFVPIPFDATTSEFGWLLNGTHKIESQHIKLEDDQSRFMTTNILHFSSVDKDDNQGNYQCYAKHCKKHNATDFSCDVIKSESSIAVQILFAPPEIKVDDHKATKFQCRQKIIDDYDVPVRFTIHRYDRSTGETYLLLKSDFSHVTEQKTNVEGFRMQTFSGRAQFLCRQGNRPWR